MRFEGVNRSAGRRGVKIKMDQPYPRVLECACTRFDVLTQMFQQKRAGTKKK